MNSLELHDRALREQVSIAPGPIFSATGRFTNCVRLNCGDTWSDRVERALETVGRIAGEMAGETA
ncbi:MAG: hypothetical protein ACREIT_06970 [Tepidisphaeraceae bacterium]